jgi:hypothetical protein
MTATHFDDAVRRGLQTDPFRAANRYNLVESTRRALCGLSAVAVKPESGGSFMKTLSVIAALSCAAALSDCYAQSVLFEDTFDGELSEKWQISGLDREDYRVRDGALEVRVKPDVKPDQGKRRPFLKVDLPFTTDDTVVASVEVTVVGEPLKRGEFAGLCLTDPSGPEFTVRKTNIDGYFVFAPGEPEFIGQPGQEGDPINYAVKYWPAAESAGPLRIIVRGDYAYFQVGPSDEGKYRTIFHSAIQESGEGLGFGLMAAGYEGDGERWVRFDNFRVTGP